MELALLKLYVRHHLLFAAIIVVLWTLAGFLAGVSESETYTRYTCSSSENFKYGFCQEDAQTALGWYAGAGTVVLTSLIVGLVVTWFTSMPTQNDVRPLPRGSEPRPKSTSDFKVSRRLHIK